MGGCGGAGEAGGYFTIHSITYHTILRLAAGRIHPNARPGQSGSLPCGGRCERVFHSSPGCSPRSLAALDVRSRKDPSLGVDPVSKYPRIHVSTARGIRWGYLDRSTSTTTWL